MRDINLIREQILRWKWLLSSKVPFILGYNLRVKFRGSTSSGIVVADSSSVAGLMMNAIVVHHIREEIKLIQKITIF